MSSDGINERVKKLSSKQQLVFQIINEGPSVKKKITSRTKLDTKEVDKLLKNMSELKLIKPVKRRESNNLNVWVRYDFLEEEEAEMDTELLEIVASMEGDVQEIKEALERKGHNTKILQDVIRVLVNSGEIYCQNKRIWKRTINRLTVPCVDCELFNMCTPVGPISPHNCPYYEKW